MSISHRMSSAGDVRAGKLETQGIEAVPEDQCHGTPLQLFWVWFAANISILGLPLGATLVAFRHLSLWQTFLVALIGSTGSFAVVGLISVAGRRGRAPSLTLSRAVFGVRGNCGPTLASLLSRWGWETVNTTVAAYVLLSLLAVLFHAPMDAKANPLPTVACIGLFVLLTLSVSGLGHATLLVVQKWAAWIFGALNLAVAAFLALHIDWNAALSSPAAPLSSVLAGIGTIAAGTGIGWANAGADMARYQAASVSGSRLVASAACGAGIPLVFLIVLGGLLSVGTDALVAASDPIAAIRSLLPSQMAIPYLIAAFGGLLLSNTLSVYSAGLTALALGLKVKRVHATIIDIVVVAAGSLLFMLVADGFYGPFIAFIELLAIPIAAWIGIFLIDMIGRRVYEASVLTNAAPGSPCRHQNGIAWRPCSVWLAASVMGLAFASIGTTTADVWFSGPLAQTWIGRNGLSWIAAILVAGGGYALLGGAKNHHTHRGV